MGHEYKNKYISLKDIYNNIKKTFYKGVNYKLYYSIITKFFEILIRDAAQRGHNVYLPNKMGYVYLDERLHKRAFHVRVDNKATKEKGETVYYKVPILDDYYKKLVWKKPRKLRTCKIIPLRYLKEIINKN